jgi:hypothetical protein
MISPPMAKRKKDREVRELDDSVLWGKGARAISLSAVGEGRARDQSQCCGGRAADESE